MKKILRYTPLLFIFIVLSCKKDTHDPGNALIVGIYDSNVIINGINPDTVITSWQVETNYSIDINQDDIEDLNISVLNEYMHGGMVLAKSELKIETLNNETFVISDSIYPKVFSLGDTIKIHDNWGNGDLLLLRSSQGCCPPTGQTHHEGYWMEKRENYIGVRYQEQLGWIKVGVPENYTSITIYEYALNK